MLMELSAVVDDLVEDATDNAQEKRLWQIRRTSNVIQALENLAIQCEGQPEFESIRLSAHEFLACARDVLRRQIHAG